MTPERRLYEALLSYVGHRSKTLDHAGQVAIPLVNNEELLVDIALLEYAPGWEKGGSEQTLIEKQAARIEQLENCLRVLSRQLSGPLREQIMAALAGDPRKRD